MAVSGSSALNRVARVARAATLLDRRAAVGGAVLLAFALAAVAPNLFTPVTDPALRQYALSVPPGPEHVLGTTAFGQDVWAQLVWGARPTLVVAAVAGVLTTVLSILVGVTAGLLGGAGDRALTVLTDVFLVLPAFPLVVVLAAYANGVGPAVIIAVVVATGWSSGARQLRAQASALRRRDFLDAARARGERSGRIVLFELLPMMAPLVAAVLLGAAIYAVLTEAGLQFVGLGDPAAVSWGTMLHWARSAEALQTGQEWWIVAPGLCVGLLGGAFALLGSALDAVADPALRRSGRRSAGPSASKPAGPAVLDGPVLDGPLLDVRGLTVVHDTADGPVTAVDAVGLSVRPGELLAVVGESGSGKTTMLMSIARLLAPTARIVSGEVRFRGSDLVVLDDRRLAPVRWRHLSVVVQSAMGSLNPVTRIERQLADAMRAHGVRDGAEIRRRSEEVLALVGVDAAHLRSYPHQLSGGMRQRTVIAMALLLSPDLLVLDEPTSALDAVTQRSVMDRISELRRTHGLAVVLATHDLSLVGRYADTVLVMYAGQVVEAGPARRVLGAPAHPYTESLLKTIPSIRGPRVPLAGIPGAPPRLAEPPAGCRYAPRCPVASADCRSAEPDLFAIDGGAARCLLHARGHPPAPAPR